MKPTLLPWILIPVVVAYLACWPFILVSCIDTVPGEEEVTTASSTLAPEEDSFVAAAERTMKRAADVDTYFYGDDHRNQFIRYRVLDLVYASLVICTNAFGNRIHKPSSMQRTNSYVIVHGGYWESVWNVDNALIDTLAPFLSSRGHVAVEVEYRRSDEVGGGWPGTNDDIVDALNMFASVQPKVWHNNS
jgi:acetyl esterase/lipase